MATTTISRPAANAHSVDPKKVVSKDEFDAKVAATFENVTRIQTPAEDTKLLAGLLGMASDAVGGSAIGFRNGVEPGVKPETCGSCGRAFSFLDVAASGLKAHTKEFMMDVMTGKHGHVVNHGTQPIHCYNCGTELTRQPPPSYVFDPWYCGC
ncbi:hypothetical protein K438DRAFT_1782921 [Mycena galopus ATCC 62051]|nr:hypothetical protein K438DRAFT_1782921 [Mycena galopus ATCC 62051]